MKDWYAQCQYTVWNGAVGYQTFWQSELSVAACGSYVFGEASGANKFIYGNYYATGAGHPNFYAPAVIALDGNNIQRRLVTDTCGCGTLQPSMLPQHPVPAATQPEITYFFILQVANNGGAANKVWQMQGDAGAYILLYMSGAGNNFLKAQAASDNGQTVIATDTVNVQADGNSYLVVVQYSFTTKTIKLIINGRVTTNTNALQNTFSYNVGVGLCSYYNNTDGACLARFLGNTGEKVLYDGAVGGTGVLSNAQINFLANNFYLNKYPSLVWVNV